METLLQVVLPMVMVLLVKMVENMLDATKIIFLQRGKHVLAGLVLILGLNINYGIMKVVVASTNYTVTLFAALGAGIGFMIAGYIGDRFFYGNHFETIMHDNPEIIRAVNDFLTREHIKHFTLEAYNKGMTEKIPTIFAFPNTKPKRLMIEKYLKESEEKFGHIVVE